MDEGTTQPEFAKVKSIQMTKHTPEFNEYKPPHQTERFDSNRHAKDTWISRREQMVSDRRGVLDAIAGQLELTPYQRERAAHLMDDIDERRFRARKTALVLLCLCGHVGREDGRDYHPNRLNATGADKFAELARDISASHSELYSCWVGVGNDVW